MAVNRRPQSHGATITIEKGLELSTTRLRFYEQQ